MLHTKAERADYKLDRVVVVIIIIFYIQYVPYSGVTYVRTVPYQGLSLLVVPDSTI